MQHLLVADDEPRHEAAYVDGAEALAAPPGFILPKIRCSVPWLVAVCADPSSSESRSVSASGMGKRLFYRTFQDKNNGKLDDSGLAVVFLSLLMVKDNVIHSFSFANKPGGQYSYTPHAEKLLVMLTLP
jgi:hypothetical protein